MWFRIAALGLGMAMAGTAAERPAVPRLTAHERSQGWRFLFDGLDAGNWRGYRQNRLPKNWSVADGELRGTAGPAIATVEPFGDFELTFEWRAEAGGSAAVYWRVAEDFPEPGQSGLKLELAGAGIECGGNGGLSTPWTEVRVEPGTWARGRVTVFGSQVDCWVNGSLVQSYVVDSPEWRAAVAASPRAAVKDFGRLPVGAVVLEAADAAFRNIKVRVSGAGR